MSNGDSYYNEQYCTAQMQVVDLAGDATDPDLDATLYFEIYDSTPTLKATYYYGTGTIQVERYAQGIFYVQAPLTGFAEGIFTGKWYASIGGVALITLPERLGTIVATPSDGYSEYSRVRELWGSISTSELSELRFNICNKKAYDIINTALEPLYSSHIPFDSPFPDNVVEISDEMVLFYVKRSKVPSLARLDNLDIDIFKDALNRLNLLSLGARSVTDLVPAKRVSGRRYGVSPIFGLDDDKNWGLAQTTLDEIKQLRDRD